MSLIGHVYLPRSSKEGKKPKASELNYGELAINYNADHEFLSVKNSSGNVITFSSDNYAKAKYDQALSETSDNAVANSAITKVILDDEKTISAALNDLNDRKLDASAYTTYDDSAIKSDISALKVSASTLQTSVENAGKVDDVKVNGTSVLSNKIANIDLTPYALSANTYTKSEIDTKITNYATTATTNALQTSINGKQDKGNYVSATTLTSNYYTKDATSGSTQISSALDKKQDKLTIDTALSETSGNLVQNSAITKVIVDNEEVMAAALNDLNDTKQDKGDYVSATTLSDYYKKTETSGSTQIQTAFNEFLAKMIGANGHEYVDLGLPSGTLWATTNVGASSPEDYGLFFQWGDTVGYTGITTDKKFDWNDYKYSVSGSSNAFTKYTDDDLTYGKKLDPEDDAARVNMGGKWHMPTYVQIRELLDNTTHVVETVNDKKGMRYTSKTDNSKSIFVPFAGGCDDGNRSYVGNFGYYWSSSRGSDVSYGYNLICANDSNTWLSNISNRYFGNSVRGVLG